MRVTISAGVAVAQNCEGFDQLYAAADNALYWAKAAGRNRVILAQGPVVAHTDIRDDMAPSLFDNPVPAASPTPFVAA